MGVVCTAWKSSISYERYEDSQTVSGLYKLSVSIWILLGLASCASVLTTVGDTYSAIMFRLQEKAVKLKELAETTSEKFGSGVLQPSLSRSTSSSSRSKHRVEHTDSDVQSEPQK